MLGVLQCFGQTLQFSSLPLMTLGGDSGIALALNTVSEMKRESESRYDRRSAAQSVLGLMTRCLVLFDSYCFVSRAPSLTGGLVCHVS
jgi:hypothetical protein